MTFEELEHAQLILWSRRMFSYPCRHSHRRW